MSPARAAVRAPVATGPAPRLLSRALRDLHASHGAGLQPIWDPREGLTVALRVPASTTLAPARTRCKACRSGLGDLVVLRLFCSYACAGLPEPHHDPEAAPRECKRAARSDEPGDWVFKQRFETPEAAARYMRPGTGVYRCRNCFFLHIGNHSPAPSIVHGTVGGSGARSNVGAPGAHGQDLFTVCVQNLLATRGESSSDPAAVAAAKRDVRAVVEGLRTQPAQAKRLLATAR